MARKKIRKQPDIILNLKCNPVTNFTDPQILKLAQDLSDTLTADPGHTILTANQIESEGDFLPTFQLIAVRPRVLNPQVPQSNEVVIIANLRIKSLKPELWQAIEICSSDPVKTEIQHSRYVNIEAKFQTLDGTAHIVQINGYNSAEEWSSSVVLQHALDHMNLGGEYDDFSSAASASGL